VAGVRFGGNGSRRVARFWREVVDDAADGEDLAQRRVHVFEDLDAHVAVLVVSVVVVVVVVVDRLFVVQIVLDDGAGSR
jgi:hypothetical protein